MSRCQRRFIVVVLTIALCSAAFGCRPRDSALHPRGPSPDQLVTAVGQAGPEDRGLTVATRNALARGLSLGVSDARGISLNVHQIPASAPSLSEQDVTALAASQATGAGTAIRDICDFLASAGVVLAGQADVITTESLLPALQSYIDWAFAHRTDDRALLGLLMATPPGGGAPPSAAPAVSPETTISPVAATMLLADILLGVAPGNQITSNTPGRTRVAEAAPSDALQRVQGLVTKVEPLLRCFAGARLVDQAQRLLAAHMAGNRFAVRLVCQPDPGPSTSDGDPASLSSVAVARSVEVSRKARVRWLVAAVVLVPSGKVVEYLPIRYSFRLISAENAGLASPMFADADLELEIPDSFTYGSSTYGGQQIRPEWLVQGYAAQIQVKTPVRIALGATKLENAEPHVAALHVSASIPWADIEPILAQHEFGLMTLGCDPDEIRGVYHELQRDVTVSPWMCIVTVPASLRTLTLTPASLETPAGVECSIVASLEGEMPIEGRYEWAVDQIGAEGQHIRTTLGVAQYPGGEFIVTFPAAGQYFVSAALRDLGTGERYAVGAAPVKVENRGGALALVVTADPAVGESKDATEFAALLEGDTAELSGVGMVTWQWDFGDGSKVHESTTRLLDSKGQPVPNRAYRIYELPGTFKVSVKLLNHTTREVITSAETKFSVAGDLVPLNRTTAVRAVVQGAWGYEVYSYLDSGQKVSSSYSWTYRGVSTKAAVIYWDGASFSGSYQGTIDAQSPVSLVASRSDSTSYTIQIRGTVSDDARTLLELNLDVKAVDPKAGRTYTERLTLRNVPLNKTGGVPPRGDGQFYATARGDAMKKYLAEYSSEEVETQSGRILQRYTGFAWDRFPDYVPTLELQFRVEPPSGGWRSLF